MADDRDDDDDGHDREAILARRSKLIAAVLVSASLGGSATACACLSPIYEDAGPRTDAGGPDAGAQACLSRVFDGGPDAGDLDAGDLDAGDLDAGDLDAGDLDAGDLDAGGGDAATDAGDTDAA